MSPRASVWLTLAIVLLTSCSTSVADRAVRIDTTACGHASKTSGAGVLVGGNEILVSAHVVVGASEIAVTIDGTLHPARILRLDPRTDLALLEVEPGPGIGNQDKVELAPARSGDEVEIVGGGPSEPIEVEINRSVEVRIEEVRSDKRSSRTGYEVSHRVQLGDSGAGVFDNQGRLIGIVFGRTQANEDRSFIVDATEIASILYEQTDSTYACDPSQHRVVEAN